MVPPDWQHPKDGRGNSRPLYDRSFYDTRRAEWETSYADVGLQATLEKHGDPPDIDEYMPDFPPGTATHYMMYETCTEGTPISPAFATPEELAHWLTDTGASAFGDLTVDYDAWVRVIGGSWCGLVMDSAGMRAEA